MYNNEINSAYNYPCIIDSLLNYCPRLYDGINYEVISKEDLINSKEFCTKSIDDFYKHTLFSESYLMTHNNNKYLILVGQPAGATGLGTDYWYYECYPVREEVPVLDFSSLIKTPYSLFFDKEVFCLSHIEVTKEFVDEDAWSINTAIITNDKRMHAFIIPPLKKQK